ncbi:putative D-lactate dehydrogenase, mitochondrial [Acipenser ruthenus]|uniref:Putative D-lactate dehydrogenase, mitochondrial n=1 Tax=Acipenser ruthenus TaxID=7906 RepID=A0A444U355_ACIRT|nr:putative D-lactate dehydrogenase, mitochondrial [Acipenser ruthenus]
MHENIMNLEVVLSDRTIAHTADKGRQTKKSAAAYSLTNLFVDSRGRWIITKAMLRLYEIIVSTVCSFSSGQAAVDSTVLILQCDILIAAYYTDVCVPISRLPLIAVETKQDLTQNRLTEEITKASSGSDFSWAKDQETRSRLWKARHDAWYAALAIRPSLLHRRVCAHLQATADRCGDKTGPDPKQTHRTNCWPCGRWESPLPDPTDPDEVQRVQEFTDRLARHALALDGTCTEEHGVGLGKRALLREEVGPLCMGVMEGVKASLDPQNLMNPGKVL